MKILYIGILPPHPGGAPISCSQLLSGFAKRGHIVYALAPLRASTCSNGDTFADKHPEIDITRYVVPHDAVNPGITPPSKEYIKIEQESISSLLPRLVRNMRPDVILIGRESFLPYVIEIASSHTIPSILMVRGGTTLALLRGEYPEEVFQRLLAQYKQANRIVAVAEHFRTGLAQMGISKVEVIPNGVDLQNFQPREPNQVLKQRLKIREYNFVVLFPALLKSIKRPLDVVVSAQKALERNPKLLYVIAGDGPLRKEMENMCHELGLMEKFRFIGWVDHSEMCDYLNLADVVIMPSDGEGLSRVYLETQACGGVLIASDIPAAREILEDGKSGLLFRTGDIEDLALKTLLAASDHSLGESISRNARRCVQAYSQDRIVEQYLNSISEVIQNAIEIK